MVIRTKKAFSLIEMIIAMLIISIAGLVATSVFTIQRPNMPQMSIRGQYACWRDDSNNLWELRCDERACAEPVAPTYVPPGETQAKCRFVLDNRPAHFFVAAVGSGSNTVPGQLITSDNPSLSGDLEIDIPTSGTNAPTSITSDKSGYALEYSAASGHSIPTNGINPTNIKKCNLLSAGNACYNDGRTGLKQESCNVLSYSASPTSMPVLKLEITCSDDAQDGGSYEPTERNSDIIDFSTIQETGSTNIALSNSMITQNNNGNITYGVTQNGIGYSFNFELFDSHFTNKNRIAGEFSNQANASSSTYKTSFKKLLENINNERSSRLTQRLLDEDNGNMNKNGAVLILW